MKKIAVVAGTPVDTRMGVDYINKRAAMSKVYDDNAIDVEAIYLPCFENPRQCHIFQMSDYAEKEAKMKDIFKRGMDQGAERFFIYCNSLSAAFDYKALGEKLNVRTVTPLDAYKKLAAEYSNVSLIAANNQATAGIEKAFTDANPDCYVMGLGMLQLVEAVESGMDPKKLVIDYNLPQLVNFFRLNGAQIFVLGCTHFPYFKDALNDLPEITGTHSGVEDDFRIIDPADLMFSMIL